MKKLAIVLLAAMLAFSLTSCKDKGDEVIATYEEFCSTVTLGMRVVQIFDTQVDFDTDTDTKLNELDISAIIGLSSGSTCEVKSIDSKAGKVEVTSNDDNSKKTVTWKNVVIGYAEEDGKTGKLTLNGTYEKEAVLNRAKATTTAYRYNFTINGTPYSASYTIDYNTGYSAASVNGKDVNLRILNAGK